MFCEKEKQHICLFVLHSSKNQRRKKGNANQKSRYVAAQEHIISRNKNVWNDKNLRQD